MKIRCVCMVRDEADVLPHTLESALGWADAIYVLDNGSTDGTWALLQEYAARHPQLVLVGREFGPYRHSLWGALATPHLDEARSGDWWCRLDADELYVDDPRDVLSRLRRYDQVVWSASIQYYFTDADLAAYAEDPAPYTTQWAPERLRYYRANWSEPRFVRHQPDRSWTEAWPKGFLRLRSAGVRIRLKHFQYRSPPQIQHRLRLRLVTGRSVFRHEKSDGWLTGGLRREHLLFPGRNVDDADRWRTRVLRADVLDRDVGDGTYRIDEENFPPMWGRDPLWKHMLSAMRRRSRHWASNLVPTSP